MRTNSTLVDKILQGIGGIGLICAIGINTHHVDAAGTSQADEVVAPQPIPSQQSEVFLAAEDNTPAGGNQTSSALLPSRAQERTPTSISTTPGVVVETPSFVILEQ